MGRKRWFLTDQQLQRLVDVYDSQSATITMLAQEWGCPRYVVIHQAQLAGVARTKETYWSTADVAYLEAHVHNTSTRTICRHLNRTATAVKLKAKRLGVRKHGEGYTIRSLSLALGEDDHKIARWVDKGLLKATMRHTDREHDSYMIHEKEVRRFIIENPSMINVQRVDGVWLIDLLANGG